MSPLKDFVVDDQERKLNKWKTPTKPTIDQNLTVLFKIHILIHNIIKNLILNVNKLQDKKSKQSLRQFKDWGCLLEAVLL